MRLQILLLMILGCDLAVADPNANLANSNLKPRESKSPRALRLQIAIAGAQQSLIHIPQQRLTLSDRCSPDFETNLTKMKCQAAQALSTARLSGVRPGQLGSRNPGSVVCKEVLHQTVVMGVDVRGDESTYCLFPDGSLVDNGTLHYYAKQNDLFELQNPTRRR